MQTEQSEQCKQDCVWFVYLLECTNDKLYTGITPNLEERFHKHSIGKGSKFTKMNRPIQMIAATPCKNRSEASRLERVIKGLTPGQKRFMASSWPLAGGEGELELIQK